jgi:hypothetical protein
MPVSPALRRYHLRFWPLMGTYVAALAIVRVVLRRTSPDEPLLYLIAVAPAVPLIGVVLVLGRYLVEEQDEFRRNMLIQAMLWGLGFMLCVTTVWGFLEVLAGAPHFPLFLCFPLFCLGMAIATPLLKWKYR